MNNNEKNNANSAELEELSSISRIYHVPDEAVPKRKKNKGLSHFGVLTVSIGVIALITVSFRTNIIFSSDFFENINMVTEISLLSVRTNSFDVKNALDRLSEILPQKKNITSPQGYNNSTLSADGTALGDDLAMLSYGSKRMPSSDNEEFILSDEMLTSPADTAEHDSQTASADLITKVTYGYYTGEKYITLETAGQLRNLTSYSNSEIYEETLLPLDFEIEVNADENEPQILIMHTHTTECYEGDQTDENYRELDSSVNMVSIGDKMTEVFESRGIRVYHDDTVHDYPSYTGSYDLSRETVQGILEEYPSIKVVLDVHRDAIERDNGEKIAPYAEMNGQECAQVMIICGCDDGTMNMPNCMENLHTASAFQQSMESKYPGLTHPILYDYRKYNQDLSSGSLLIEIDGHANTHEEAINAAALAADGIADALLK